MSISLIIPTYKNPVCLDLCLKSASENKTLETTEIVVIVDGFVDENREILEKYSNSINVLPLETNQGMQQALNMGVMQSSTDLIFIINDDNVMPKRWDARVIEDFEKAEGQFGKHVVLTIDQIEPTGPGMFNFPVLNLGISADKFQYYVWLVEELKQSSEESFFSEDGHIFPFIVQKKFYMAVGGFDTFYNSPNICDWDHFLKYELLGFHFPRSRRTRLYHFGSVATKKNSEAQNFISRETIAIEQFMWKWGISPYNKPNNNSKIPPDGQFRGFTAI
jgi:glycosyltransferase involved in cell wall biosynthesis